MTRKLIKSGNSQALVVSKDMKEHLGLSNGCVEIEFTTQGILIKKETIGRSFDEAVESTLKKYHNAFAELAK